MVLGIRYRKEGEGGFKISSKVVESTPVQRRKDV